MVQLLAAPSLLAPGGAPVRPRRLPANVPLCVPPALAVVTAALYGTFALVQWRRFESPSWDLGIFTEVVQDYGRLQAPVVPIKGPGVDLLGDHFSPVLALLGPVWDVFPSPVTLLMVQVLLVAISVLFVTRLAVSKLPLGAAVAVGVGYAFSFGLQGAVNVQFHEVAFAVPLLALSLAAFISDRPRRAALWALPLLLVKEDLGLTVAVIGVLLLTRGARRWGGVLIVVGVGGFLVITCLLIPAANSAHGWHYSASIPIGRYLSDPWSIVTTLGDPRKVQTVALLIGTAGLVGCRSLTFLTVVPTLLWRFYSTNTGYYGYDWHYNAVLMPVAAIALVDVLSRWDARRRRGRLMLAAGVAAATSVLLIPSPPLWRLVQPAFFADTARMESARAALALVPAGRVVVSDSGLIAYLAAKDTTYYAGAAGIPAPDYYVIDTVSGGWSSKPDDLAGLAEGQYPGHRYELIYSRDGYEVAARSD